MAAQATPAVRKFVFVPSELIARIGTSQNVQREHGDSLRGSTYSVLGRKDLSEDVRAAEFIEEQQRFLTQKRLAEQPVKLSIETEQPDVGKSNDVLYGVIHSFQSYPAYQQLVERLVSFLPGIQGLQWNRRGEIVVDGHRIPRSNLVALVSDVVTPAPSSNPIGGDQFAQLIRRSDIPPQIIRETTGRYGPLINLQGDPLPNSPRAASPSLLAPGIPTPLQHLQLKTPRSFNLADSAYGPRLEAAGARSAPDTAAHFLGLETPGSSGWTPQRPRLSSSPLGASVQQPSSSSSSSLGRAKRILEAASSRSTPPTGLQGRRNLFPESGENQGGQGLRSWVRF